MLASEMCVSRREGGNEGRRRALLARIGDNPHLPTLPTLALRVVEQAGQADCTLADLADLIRLDPPLCGKVLRTVNSALYGLPRAITSVERALALLGLRSVRSLVLSLSLSAVQWRGLDLPAVQSFWRASVAGAVVAHEMAVRLGRPNPEDDLVAGLLRDVGMLVLHQVCPGEYQAILDRPAEELAREQCALEEKALGVHHAEVSAYLLRRWRLPEDVTEPVRLHHAPGRTAELPRAVAERADLLDFATRIAQLQLTPWDPQLLRDLFTTARDRYGMGEAQLAAFLEPINHKIAEFASLVEVDVGTLEQLPQVILRATEELVRLTTETSLENLRIAEQKQYAEQEAQRWRQEASRLLQEATRDGLTGTYNRGSFEAELDRAFRRARRRGTLLGLLFLDLDGFKGLNDRFGHVFGDQVLREVGGRLLRTTRQGDVVGRYGGDEFCILVADSCEPGLRAMAGRLWQDLHSLSLRADDRIVRVGVSVGVAFGLPRRSLADPRQLLDAADRAMYAAKAAGKSQVTVVSLLDPADLALLEEVRRRLFSVYLTDHEGLNLNDLDRLRFRAPHSRHGPGRLARRLGWIKPESLAAVLQDQRRTRRRFDEVALEQGCLTASQLHSLLALQSEPPEPLAASLVKHGVWAEEVVRGKVRDYYRALAGLDEFSIRR